MQNFESVNAALDFAISEEEAANRFYVSLASKVKRPGMKGVLLEFAEEENGHRKKLVDLKNGRKLAEVENTVTDLKLTDYLVDVEPGEHISYQDALVIAMKKEKAAFKMYTDLAAMAPDSSIRATFLSLAQEEAKHKVRFELEYDDQVLTEN